MRTTKIGELVQRKDTQGTLLEPQCKYSAIESELIAEARKYKTAEEFLASQEEVVDKRADADDKRLDEIFNELRDNFSMDDSINGDLTIVIDGEWEVVTRVSEFLTQESKKLVDEYYDLLLNDEPVKTKAQLTDIWNKANEGKVSERQAPY